ncbi:lipase family protein [Xenorhabdus sp. PB30.3]|uniref:lipase family protein n=1 Tax=Xenorhabdus sp. PB30.3 TaxID=2788941 RepID=UPI001E431533|nr:lipase family protein [Xenorhabdus sp. PB30.3]MCC8380870.1 lipase family protein [Xenorhabdus sp. PB30.3]
MYNNMLTKEAQQASLILYAAEMNSQYYNNPTPPADPRLAEDGWDLVAYISGNDLSFSVNPKSNQQFLIMLPKHVCYGYIAKNKKTPAEYVIVIRGTDSSNLFEALHDIVPVFTSPWADTPQQKVSMGFYSVYNSLKLTIVEPESKDNYSHLRFPNAVAQFIGINTAYTILGHSLGAVIATYLMRDIPLLGDKHKASLFASPRAGNHEFVSYIDNHFANYETFRYENDLVPHLPPDIPFILEYESLSKSTILKTSDGLNITDSLRCNHYLTSYIALLDPEQFKKLLNEPQDSDSEDVKKTAKCISLTPPSNQ